MGVSRGKMPLESNGVGINSRRLPAESVVSAFQHITYTTGDYKEFPYYLTNDLKILDTIIREMAVTNRVFNTGFPFRVIETSKYIKSMRKIFKQDLNKCLIYASREVHINRRACLEIEPTIKSKIVMEPDKTPANPLMKDKRIRSKKALKELELWYDSYLNEPRNQESSGTNDDLSPIT